MALERLKDKGMDSDDAAEELAAMGYDMHKQRQSQATAHSARSQEYVGVAAAVVQLLCVLTTRGVLVRRCRSQPMFITPGVKGEAQAVEAKRRAARAVAELRSMDPGHLKMKTDKFLRLESEARERALLRTLDRARIEIPKEAEEGSAMCRNRKVFRTHYVADCGQGVVQAT